MLPQEVGIAEKRYERFLCPQSPVDRNITLKLTQKLRYKAAIRYWEVGRDICGLIFFKSGCGAPP